MKEIDDFYLKRYYAFYLWARDNNRSPDYTLEEYNNFKAAYERKDWNLVKWADKDLMAAINEAPTADRREIYKYIERETGVKADKEEEKFRKKLEAILKRGKIRNEDEYHLVHGEIDNLLSENFDDPVARERALELDRIMMKYSTSFEID